jgi:DNA-binding transcriptional MerR regulator
MNKLSIKEACELAGISRPTIYKYIKNGTLSVVKDDKNTFVEVTELLRVFPDSKLNTNKDNANSLHSLTQDVQHKDELIAMLKQELDDKRRDNEFLKDQLTQASQNITQVNNLLENKLPKKRKKFLGIF